MLRFVTISVVVWKVLVEDEDMLLASFGNLVA